MKTKISRQLSKAALERNMQTKWLGRTVIFLPEVDSTNDYLKRMANQQTQEGLLVVAKTQTNGRGRRGRIWESEKGKGIFMTVLLKPDIAPELVAMLTLVVAVSVADALSQQIKRSLQIKWPNDILLAGKKICGILTEMSTEGKALQSVYVGIGINLEQRSFPGTLQKTATSLWLQGIEIINRVDCIAKILLELEKNYELFLQEGTLRPFRQRYEALLINRGKWVKTIGAVQTEGKALGITDFGALCIQKKDESIEEIVSGEVSIRAKDGNYVSY